MPEQEPELPAQTLLAAATNGDLARVQELIEAGADLTECEEYTALSQAAESGRADIVDALLKAGADVNFGGFVVPLCSAVRSADLATVKRLLEAKPKVDAQEEEGDTALMLAAFMGNLEMVKSLVAAGASAKKKDNDGETAIISGMKHPAIVEFLRPLSTKADVKYVEKELSEPDETTEAFLAAVEAADLARIKDLLARGVKLAALGKNGEAALHVAVASENIEIVELLLHAGASPKVRNQYGRTPLFTAVHMRNPVLVERLIQAGAEVNAKDKLGGATPFLSTVGDRPSDQEMMRLLARHGADIHAVDDYGRSALNIAGRYLGVKTYYDEEDRPRAEALRKTFVDIGILHPDANRFTEVAAAGDLAAVRGFIESGVPVNTVDEEDRTALYMAISRRHPELVAYLLKAGADVHKPAGSDSGEDKRWGGFDRPCPKCGHVFTALTLVWRCPKCSHEFKAQEVFGKDADTELFMTWSNGHRPLVTAARLGDVPIITRLLDAGAQVDRGVEKITPLMYACYFGHLEAAKTLITRGADPKLEGKTPDRVAAKVSAILYAGQRGQIELVKLLWDSGVPGKDKNSTLLVDAARKNDVPAILQLLAEGVEVNQADPLTGERALDMAAREGNAEAAAALIAAGAMVNPAGRELPPLWYVVNGLERASRREPLAPEAVQRYVETAKVLLAAGAQAAASFCGIRLADEAERIKCSSLTELLKAAIVKNSSTGKS